LSSAFIIHVLFRVTYNPVDSQAKSLPTSPVSSLRSNATAEDKVILSEYCSETVRW
jgi:hypothetical protein